jgi:regulator of protease activity HflC (stomatin/prohibitin superfamily)
MVAKYYSELPELLNVVFDTEEVCRKAEEAVIKERAQKEAAKKKEQEAKKKLQEERAARAKEVEEAYKIAREANRKAGELMNKFVADYGSFHMTLKDTSPTNNILEFNFNSFWTDFLKFAQQLN